MSFEKYLKKSRILIKNNLALFLLRKKQEKISKTFHDLELLVKLEKFVIQGKMIRGSLFLLSIQMMGGKISNQELDIASAIELMHSSLLIQDDIIDRDYQRRGQDTIFAQYENKGQKMSAQNSYHYGISMGIIVSDVALFLALELLSKYKHKSLSELLKFYSNEIYMVALAQGADTDFGQTKKEPSKEEIYDVYKHKTARYTFSLPFEMAGIISNANKKDIEVLSKIGELAGVIFQIKDDEIGLLGRDEKIGKVVGSDIKENKKTLIRALLFEKSDGKDVPFLKKSFGNINIKGAEIEKIKKLIYKYKILDILNVEIDSLMEGIWKEFKKLKLKKEFQDILKDLLEFNRDRTS